MSARIDERLRENGVTPEQYLNDWGHTCSPAERGYLKALIASAQIAAAPTTAVAVAEPEESTSSPVMGRFASIALPLAKMGVPMTPVRPGTKRAFLPDFPTTATTDPAQIMQWDAQYPDHNAACVARAEQGGVFFFEVDSQDVVPRLEAETGQKMPTTFMVRSRPGRGHFYFRHNAASMALGNISQTYVKGQDWSVRTNREYVVAPGSIHPDTGKPYEALNWETPIVEAPQWLIDWLLSQKIQKNQNITATADAPRNEQGLVPHGAIHGYMLSEAGRLRNLGLGEESIRVALRELVEKNCQPPIDWKKVDTMAKSICNFPAGENKSLALTQQPDAPAQDDKRPIVITDGDQFLAEEIAPRTPLIVTISGSEPVIFEQSINQVFAWRGIGKTCLGLGFVRAFATGGYFLNFRATERVHVLYVEGELPDSQFQERWRSIVGKTDGYAHLASVDKQPGHHFVSLATDEGMERVETALMELQKKGINVKVLMLDNISTLFNIAANDEEVWIRIQAWLISLRSRGLTVFFFHHAGKGGLSRSHSKSEDMLDVSIKLEEPDEVESGHLHAILTFDKARAGLSERAAEIKLHRTHSPNCRCGGKQTLSFCPGDSVRWEHKPKKDKKAEAHELFANGATAEYAAKMLDVPFGTVKGWRTAWGRQHLLQEAAKKPSAASAAGAP